MTTAQLVTDARKRAGYPTIYALSKATGISSGAIYDIEHGNRSPSVATLQRLFTAIGWEVLLEFRKKP